MFTEQDIYEAYRKFKSYVYYDNTSLFVRKQIAEYEADLIQDTIITEFDNEIFKELFKNKTEKLLSILNMESLSGIDIYIEDIKSKFVPKTISEADQKRNFITNKLQEEIKVDQCNFIIDAPIEIHIISVLWLMYTGRDLNKHIDKHNYAYQLQLNGKEYRPTNNISINSESDDENIVSGLQLFQPYFIGYQRWRDEALDTAIKILDSNKNATILSLDIKRFFYSAKVELPKLVEKLNPHPTDINKSKKLTSLLDEINKAYTKTILPYLERGQSENDDTSVLPVGLLSSGFISNLYLTDFDKSIIEKLNPIYYGRYVDDMLFVFADREVTEIPSFIKGSFIDNNILVDESDDNNKEYILSLHPNLSIQNDKIILEHFYPNESRAAINKFKLNLEKQRSEFRFLPDEEKISKEFDDEAFSIQYSDSINKLRSIQEYGKDKYGASRFLAHKIFLSSFIPNKHISNTDKDLFYKSSKQILNFFKGRTCISFYTLWEKVTTYFIINSEIKCLELFYMQAISAISKIEGHYSDELKLNLIEYLEISIAIPYSMNLKFKLSDILDIKNLDVLSKNFRYSNLFRHNLLAITGVNYTTALFNCDNNLYSHNIGLTDKSKINILHYLSPRFVHYNELNIYKAYEVLNNNKGNIEEDITLSDINSGTEDLYHSINYNWRYMFLKKDKQSESSCKLYSLKENKEYCYLSIKEDETYIKNSSNKRIAIANIKVEEKNILSSVRKKPILTKERRKILFNIINNAVKEKCDIIVLPELSVPFQWLDFLAYQSRSKNIAIIAGLEYFVNESDIAYNCVATILPIRQNKYSTSIIRLRTKNHYAPSEVDLLTGYRLKIPKSSKSYDLFHWRKSYFSIYNCFELANIIDRALFKSKVDFIVATVLNKDISYFSDIAGSWVRDVHSYFIQVNTSQYGDSKIIQPSKTATKNIVIVKGGRNSTVLVDDLDIDALRDFQNKEHNLQQNDERFKLTPPEYNKENVLIRINNDDFDK